MSLNDAVFGAQSTLWEVLDSENISNVNVELTRLNNQIITLGSTVDTNDVNTNDRITQVNSRVANLDTEVAELNTEISFLNSEVTQIQDQLDALDLTGINSSISALQISVVELGTRMNAVETSNAGLQTQVQSLNSQVGSLRTDLENFQALSQRYTVLTGGNQYIWNYRVNTQNHTRRITFEGTSPIVANQTRQATWFDTIDLTERSGGVKLIAFFDTFRINGTIQYDMMLGSCYMQIPGQSQEGPLGYMSPL